MKKIFSFFFFFLLIGCSQKEAIKPKPVPSWYLNPPKSNERFVYVTGGGINKRAAILNALSNFISRYSVTISSNFESKAQDFGGGLANKNSIYNIKATVKKFEVSNYDVIKAERYKFDQFLVLVRVDVNKLYKDLENKLNNRFKKYKDKYRVILNKNTLKQLIEIKELYSQLKKEEDYIYVLKLMNSNFNEKKYLSFINEVKRKLESLKNSVYVEVLSNNKIIAEDIKRYLTNKSIKIGKSNIKIIVNVKKRKSSSFVNLIVYEIYINVKYKNSIIGSNYFKVTTLQKSSINGYLYNDIKELSLEKFLNLK
ncbi:hypothetical protein JCM11957_01800 [Caminibacter profundus]